MSPSPADRPRPLVSLLAVAVIAAVLAALLLLLYPGRGHGPVGTQADYAAAPLDYLQTLLNNEPQNDALRRSVLRKQIAAGDFAAARRTLADLKPADPQAAWLRLQIDWGEFVATAPDDPRRAAARRRVAADLEALPAGDTAPLDEAQLEVLATDFLALGQPQRAAPLYEALALRQPQRAYARWAQAGRWWLAAGQPARAQQAWERALSAAATSAQRRDAGSEAMRAARMAGGRQSLQLAQTLLEQRPDDPGLLQQGIDVALASRRPDLALAWARRLAALRPDDDQAQRRRLDLALADGRLPEALEVARALARRHPDDWRLQFRLAQLLEWNGYPDQALRQYLAVSKAHPDAQVDARIVALGVGTHDAPAVADALLRQSRRRRLSPSEMTLLVDELDDQMDQPRRAAQALQGWLRDEPADRPLWERLAGIYADTDRPERALQTWRRIAGRYGRGLTETRARARLQIRQWHFGAALRTMLSLLRPAPAPQPQDPGYWQELGDLGWLHNDLPAVVKGYGWLYEHRPEALTAADASRLVTADLRVGDADAAARVAVGVWRRRRDPSPLLLALDGAMTAARRDLAGRLLALADGAPQTFAGNVDYWRLRGAYLQADDAAGAAAAYRQALRRRPDDGDLRAAYLYALIDQGDTPALARALRRWRDEAAGSPALWAPYALGYSRLEQPRQALPWFARRAAAQPDDAAWLLSYADALDAARRFDAAYRLRRFAYARLRARLGEEPRFATSGRGGSERPARDGRAGPGSKPPVPRQGWRAQRTYEEQRALLQDARLGADFGLHWLRRLLSLRGPEPLDARDFESLVDWHLAHGQPAYARFWALRARRDGVRLPAEQRLALALAADDRHAVGELLARGGSLSLGDRVEALRRIGRDADALRLALDPLDPRGPWIPGGEQLPQAAAELRARQPRDVGATVSALRIGDLRAYTELAAATDSRQRWSVTVQTRATQFARRGLALDLDRLGHEYAGRVELVYRGRRGITTVEGGRVQTGAVDFSQAGLSQSYRFTERLTGDAFARYHEQTLDSALFRVLGTRDAAGLDLQYAADARDALSLTAQGLRYQTRWNEHLGSGYQFSGELDHALLRGRSYELGLRLSTAYIGNQLKAHLPPRVAARLPVGTGIDALLPDQYGVSGFGVTIARGRPNADYPAVSGLRYAVDLGADYIWTDRRVGLHFDAGVGRHLFGGDDLNLFFRFDRTQATTGGTTQTVGLRYRYFFGR
ncbi:MAG: tetratricopeptide repeat protein [Gammaproteobacteria bacterium]|nr:tetratricopeptide repeat protein [Gammaproteobacteria bacterium]